MLTFFVFIFPHTHRGLCSVYRSTAGQVPAAAAAAAAAAADGEINQLQNLQQQPSHNSHWLRPHALTPNQPAGAASRFVGYYDAASLYPASSKSVCVCVCFLILKKNFG